MEDNLPTTTVPVPVPPPQPRLKTYERQRHFLPFLLLTSLFFFSLQFFNDISNNLTQGNTFNGSDTDSSTGTDNSMGNVLALLVGVFCGPLVGALNDFLEFKMKAEGGAVHSNRKKSSSSREEGHHHQQQQEQVGERSTLLELGRLCRLIQRPNVILPLSGLLLLLIGGLGLVMELLPNGNVNSLGFMTLLIIGNVGLTILSVFGRILAVEGCVVYNQVPISFTIQAVQTLSTLLVTSWISPSLPSESLGVGMGITCIFLCTFLLVGFNFCFGEGEDVPEEEEEEEEEVLPSENVLLEGGEEVEVVQADRSNENPRETFDSIDHILPANDNMLTAASSSSSSVNIPPPPITSSQPPQSIPKKSSITIKSILVSIYNHTTYIRSTIQPPYTVLILTQFFGMGGIETWKIVFPIWWNNVISSDPGNAAARECIGFNFDSTGNNKTNTMTTTGMGDCVELYTYNTSLLCSRILSILCTILYIIYATTPRIYVSSSLKYFYCLCLLLVCGAMLLVRFGLNVGWYAWMIGVGIGGPSGIAEAGAWAMVMGFLRHDLDVGGNYEESHEEEVRGNESDGSLYSGGGDSSQVQLEGEAADVKSAENRREDGLENRLELNTNDTHKGNERIGKVGVIIGLMSSFSCGAQLIIIYIIPLFSTRDSFFLASVAFFSSFLVAVFIKGFGEISGHHEVDFVTGRRKLARPTSHLAW